MFEGIGRWFVGDGRAPTQEARVFTEAELWVATQNFNPSKKIGTSEASTFYAGRLHNDQEVAVKVINVNSATAARCHLADEMDAVCSVSGPSILSPLGFGSGSGKHFIVYPLLTGGNLLQRLLMSRARGQVGHKPFPWQERLRVAAEVADALRLCHTSSPKVFHRRVKSTNVLFDSRRPAARLTDFGLEELALNPAAFQHELSDLDARGFGTVLLDLLTGEGVPSSAAGGPGGATARSLLASLDPTAEWPPAFAQELGDIAIFCLGGGSVKQPVVIPAVQRVHTLLRAAAGGAMPERRSIEVPTDPQLQDHALGWATDPRQAGPGDDPPTQPQLGLGPLGPSAQVPQKLRAAGPPQWQPAGPRARFTLICTQAIGLELEAMPARSLEIDLDKPGMITIGRQHQQGFFENILGSSDGRSYLCCVSRSHLEVEPAPGRPPGYFKVKNLSANPVQVSRRLVDKSDSDILRHGEAVDFIAADREAGHPMIYLRLCLDDLMQSRPDLMQSRREATSSDAVLPTDPQLQDLELPTAPQLQLQDMSPPTMPRMSGTPAGGQASGELGATPPRTPLGPSSPQSAAGSGATGAAAAVAAALSSVQPVQLPFTLLQSSPPRSPASPAQAGSPGELATNPQLHLQTVAPTRPQLSPQAIPADTMPQLHEDPRSPATQPQLDSEVPSAPYVLQLGGTAVLQGFPAERRMLTFGEDGITVGRAHQLELHAGAVMDGIAQYISREHFRVEPSSDGGFRLIPLSGNPIWHVHDGWRTELCSGDEPAWLEPGDSVMLFTGAKDRSPDGPGHIGTLQWTLEVLGSPSAPTVPRLLSPTSPTSPTSPPTAPQMVEEAPTQPGGLKPPPGSGERRSCHIPELSQVVGRFIPWWKGEKGPAPASGQEAPGTSKA